MNILEKASYFAKLKHTGQLDDEQKDYYKTYIEQVVSILYKVTEDDIILSAAYLHDTLEDTNTTEEELRNEFGNKITSVFISLD